MASRERFLSKVIVRNLPIGLDEAGFRQLIGESVSSVDYLYYVPGKLKPKATDVLSRAYLNFTNQAALLAFSEKFDGHTFLDSKGGSLACSVEYAQSQLKVRRTSTASSRHAPKPDNLVGTIENDEHYKNFLASLTAPVAASSSDADAPVARGLTPLLAAIKAKDQKKFDEKMARKNKKRGAKKAVQVVTKPAASANKRKKQRKKKAENGPQFGAVKILGASQQASPNITTSTAPSTAPSGAPEGKRRRQRKPKVKKTGDGAQATASPKPKEAKVTAS